eukprot:gene8827-10439_t
MSVSDSPTKVSSSVKLNAKAREFVPSSFGESTAAKSPVPIAKSQAPERMSNECSSQIQNNYNNCNGGRPNDIMSPAPVHHISHTQIVAAQQGLLYDPASNAMYSFMNGVPVFASSPVHMPTFPGFGVYLAPEVEGEMATEYVIEDNEVIEAPVVVAEVPIEEAAIVNPVSPTASTVATNPFIGTNETPRGKSSPNLTSVAASTAAVVPAVPLVEPLPRKDSAVRSISTTEALPSLKLTNLAPSCGECSKTRASGSNDIGANQQGDGNTLNLDTGDDKGAATKPTHTMHYQAVVSTSTPPRPAVNEWSVVHSHRKKKKNVAFEAPKPKSLGAHNQRNLVCNSIFSPELLADADDDLDSADLLAFVGPIPSTLNNIATHTSISTSTITSTTTNSNKNSNSSATVADDEHGGPVPANLEVSFQLASAQCAVESPTRALAKEGGVKVVEGGGAEDGVNTGDLFADHNDSVDESSNVGQNSDAKSGDDTEGDEVGVGVVLFDLATFLSSNSINIIANSADAVESAEGEGDLHSGQAHSPSASLDCAYCSDDDFAALWTQRRPARASTTTTNIDGEGMDGDVSANDEEEADDKDGKFCLSDINSEGGDDSSSEDDEGYAEYLAKYDPEAARRSADSIAAGFDDDEMLRQYKKFFKPTISRTILYSTLSEEKLLELVNKARVLANTHPLYGLYQDNSEETQRKMELNYVRKRERSHEVTYVPGQECFIRCAFCWKPFLLHLSKKNGKEHLQAGNLYQHCTRRHLSRNALGQEVVSTSGERGDREPAPPFMAKSEPGMIMRPRTTAANNKNTANTTNTTNKSSNRLLISEESNTKKYVPLRREHVEVVGDEYAKMWTDPDDEAPCKEAVNEARVAALKDEISLVEYMMREADPDATSEGDVEEDAGSLADEKAPVGFFEVKRRVKKALEAMNTNGMTPLRAAVKIVMDSAEYKKMPAELRFEKL